MLFFSLSSSTQCQSYSRVLGEQAAKVGDADGDDLDVDVTKVDTDDKTFALMGISKTIMTVSCVLP